MNYENVTMLKGTNMWSKCKQKWQLSSEDIDDRESEASVIDCQIDRQGFQCMDTRLQPNERC